ncbi:site-2 protease family protein [Undibacterium sp. CY18W]|uniref:Site-2 protease family protein n=2 Tax=Undibacterium hunanense TaxID=2762292 RepID=A0ABR6ZYF8_9BURK|nr:site-2 protease family protein [Undibacterium hunanense]
MSIAAAGRAAGVRIMAISIGLGPVLIKHNGFILKLLPINGYVKFLDSRACDVSDNDLPFAFDHQSIARQIMIALAGCTVHLVLAVVLVGASAWHDWIAFPVQYVVGALSPFDDAQILLHEAGRLIDSSTFLTLMGIVAAKLAAYHLFPMVGFNGWQIIITLAQHLGLNKFAPDLIYKADAFLTIATSLSWCLAIAYAVRPW